MVTEADVRAALGKVVDPSRGTDIVSAGQVTSLSVSGDEVRFVLEVDPARAAAMEPLRQAAEAAVQALDGVTRVSAVMTAHAAAGQAAPAKAPVPDLGLKDFTPKPKAPAGPEKLPGVRHVVVRYKPATKIHGQHVTSQQDDVLLVVQRLLIMMHAVHTGQALKP